MNTLIIGDVHNHAETAIECIKRWGEGCDEVIFMGDYFDDFGDTDADIIHMCNYLNSVMDNPRYVFLVGNHDLHYLFSYNAEVRCSGYKKNKADIINRHLRLQDFKERLVLGHVRDNYLFSHAGFSEPFVLRNYGPDTIIDEDWLKKEKDSLFDKLSKNITHKLLFGGSIYAHETNSSCGPFWLRPYSNPRMWGDHIQIVGHTPHNIITTYAEGKCIVVDTLPHYCGLLSDGVLEHKFLDLTNTNKDIIEKQYKIWKAHQ